MYNQAFYNGQIHPNYVTLPFTLNSNFREAISHKNMADIPFEFGLQYTPRGGVTSIYLVTPVWGRTGLVHEEKCRFCMVFNHWDKKQNLKIIADFKAFSNSNPI